MRGELLQPKLRRWLILFVLLAAVWPGLLFFLEFFADDRSMYDDANELDAFGVIFSPMPIALLFIAFATVKRQPYQALGLAMAGFAGFLLTTLLPCLSAFEGGLGASSKEDVDCLEWNKIAIWTGMLLILWLILIGLDALGRWLARSAR